MNSRANFDFIAYSCAVSPFSSSVCSAGSASHARTRYYCSDILGRKHAHTHAVIYVAAHKDRKVLNERIDLTSQQKQTQQLCFASAATKADAQGACMRMNALYFASRLFCRWHFSGWHAGKCVMAGEREKKKTHILV